MDLNSRGKTLGMIGLVASAMFILMPKMWAEVRAGRNVPAGLSSGEITGWKSAEKVCGDKTGLDAIACVDEGLEWRRKNGRAQAQKDGMTAEQYAAVTSGLKKWRDAKAKELPASEIPPAPTEAPAPKPRAAKPVAKKSERPSPQAELEAALAKMQVVYEPPEKKARDDSGANK